MDTAALLLELYGRIPPLAARAVDGLDEEELFCSPEPGANPWVGSSGIWPGSRTTMSPSCSVPSRSGSAATGPGAPGSSPIPPIRVTATRAEEVASVRPESPEVLLDYLHEVQGRTTAMLERLAPDELDRVVDERWDPPVTLGVRLVSIADDSLQHAGQAAYVRGLLTTEPDCRGVHRSAQVR